MTDTAVAAPAAPAAEGAPAPAPQISIADARAAARAPVKSPSAATSAPAASAGVPAASSPAGQAAAKPASPTATPPAASPAGRDGSAADPSATTTPAPSSPPAGTEGASGAPTPGSSTDSASETLPEGWTWLDVQEGNPLRDRGKTRIPCPPGLENEFRSILNDPVRRARVEQAERALTEVQEEALTWKTATEFYVARALQLVKDPTISETYARYVAEFGEQHAELWLSGLMDQDEKGLETKLSEAKQAQIEKQGKTEAAAFRLGATRHLMGAYPGITEPQVKQLIGQFAALASAGYVSDDVPIAHSFKQFAQRQLGSAPQPAAPAPVVDPAAERAALKAELLAELRAEEQNRMRAVASGRAPHPLAAIAPAGHAAPLPSGDRQLTITEAKQALRTPLAR